MDTSTHIFTGQKLEGEINSATNAVFSYDSIDASDDARNLFELVNMCVLTTAVCLLGIVSNLINVTVFYRQGMRSTINISFMALSITDLCNILLIQWLSISAYPIFLNSPDLAILPKDISYLSAGAPHGCFSRIAAWITAYMAAERFLCIALPFKVKHLITPTRTILAMVAIGVFTSLPMMPQYLLFKLGWIYYSELNKTLIGLTVNPEYISLDGLSSMIYSIEMIVSFFIVIVITLGLILQLNKMSQWRNGSLVSGDQSMLLSKKDKMAVRTVVVIACVLIITFTPSITFCGACFIVPGFALRGQYSNIYTILVSFVLLFDAINASVNAALYFTMNTGYRRTLLNMLSTRRNAKTFF